MSSSVILAKYFISVCCHHAHSVASEYSTQHGQSAKCSGSTSKVRNDSTEPVEQHCLLVWYVLSSADKLMCDALCPSPCAHRLVPIALCQSPCAHRLVPIALCPSPCAHRLVPIPPAAVQRAVASLAYYKGYFMRGQGQWPALDRCVDGHLGG